MAPQEGRPFVLSTESGQVVVVGTSFGVRAPKGSTEVTLVEGSLLLARRDGKSGVRLTPGQRSRVVRGERPSAPERVDVSEALAWSGLLVFRDTPLADALRQIEQRYNIRVTAPASLAAEPVTGTFDAAQTPAEMLRALATSLEVEVDETGGAFRLR